MPEAAPPIVVGFDGSGGAHEALRWAMDEAARTGAPVILLYAFDWPVATGTVGFAPAVWPDYGAEEEADRVVAAALADARRSRPEVEVTGTVVPGAATAVLVARSRRARLVVLGGRGAGGFAGQLIGSTSVSVSAHAHCPVVVVRGGDPPPGARVVVGFDGSAHSLRAVEFAFAAASRRGAGLRVVQAGDPPDAGADLAAWRDRYPGMPTSVDTVTAPPAEALIEASRDARLVAVGSRGRGGFRGMLLGSVSQQLLYHAACPVAVVRDLPT